MNQVNYLGNFVGGKILRTGHSHHFNKYGLKGRIETINAIIESLL